MLYIVSSPFPTFLFSWKASKPGGDWCCEEVRWVCKGFAQSQWSQASLCANFLFRAFLLFSIIKNSPIWQIKFSEKGKIQQLRIGRRDKGFCGPANLVGQKLFFFSPHKKRGPVKNILWNSKWLGWNVQTDNQSWRSSHFCFFSKLDDFLIGGHLSLKQIHAGFHWNMIQLSVC